MSELDSAIQKVVDERVQKLEADLRSEFAEMFRAVMGDAPRQSDGFVDALEVAKLLGRDLSSKEKVRKAKKYVYNLAAQNLIPSIRLSERSLVFDPIKVREYLKTKERNAA
jgi:hypothetical protein